MFQEISAALDNIINIGNPDQEYDEEKRNKVKKISYGTFYHILNMIHNHRMINLEDTVIYKQNLFTDKFEEVTYVLYDKMMDLFPIVIDSSDDSLILTAPSTYFLAEYIKKEIKNNYIVIPVNYACGLIDSGHIAILAINNVAKNIYLLDPNGKPDYFNNVFTEDVSQNVELLISNYLNLLKQFDLDYKYVNMKDWNPTYKSINNSLDSKYDINVGNGNCLIITVMLSHLILKADFDPSIIYEAFVNLSTEELLFLIKNYSLAIFSLL